MSCSRIVAIAALTAACHHGHEEVPGDGNNVLDVDASSSDGPNGGDGGTHVTGGFCVEDDWCWQRPRPFGTTLHAVWGSSPGDVWAVGDGGTIAHYDGSTPHPGPSYLNAIWGNASNDIWIAYSGGNGGMHYDGHTWQTTIAGPGGDSTAMHGTATDDIWCVGLAGLMTHFDGGAWSAKPANTTASLYAVRAFSTTDAWAAGDAGTLIHWNGSSWQAAQAPPLSGTDVVINSLAGTSSTDLWAATSGGQIFHWNGSAWSRSAQLSVSIGSLARLPSGAMFVAGGNGAILRRGP